MTKPPATLSSRAPNGAAERMVQQSRDPAPHIGKRTKVAAEVARSIMRQATNRKLKPGDRVASEQEMIDGFGVARSSVREGLRLLEAMGAVRLRRGAGGGATLQRPPPEQLAGTLAMMLQWWNGTLETLMEARVVIEPEMTALASQRRTGEQLKQLHDLVSLLRQSVAAPMQFFETNRQFHRVVAEASGNALFVVLVVSINWMSSGTVDWVQPNDIRRRIVEEKAAITEAIELRNASLASERMRQAIIATEDYSRSRGSLRKPIVWADVDELLTEHLNGSF